MTFKTTALLAALAAPAMTGSALALEVSSNINTDTVWTIEDSPVILRDHIYVTDGASLTIEAGVVVVTGDNDDGGIVIERDSQIFVLGTREQPVIMTSADDVATWTGSVVQSTDGDPDAEEVVTLGNPKSGTWREAAQEWRNLTICGRGVISASHFKGVVVTNGQGQPNPKIPNGTADKVMEGLSAASQDIRYGGSNDNDDSGTIQYLSTRYGGRVLGQGNELNGLSLGALGRGTDLSYIEIMNNVDDGIEIWGGAADLKYFTIWNIGDDSLDFDQGWRGRAQFGLIVQGYSLDADQGSGVGDNAIEGDGAEDSDAQPWSTVTIQNVTIIGGPNHDGLTAWRDNARIQFRKMVFVTEGDSLVRFDDTDGDGGNRYGYNGTHTWQQVWNTSHSSVSNGVNDGSGDFSPANLYKYAGFEPQYAGNLAGIYDSVYWAVPTIFRNASGAAAYDPTPLITAPAANNVNAGNTLPTLPVKNVTRNLAGVTKGGLLLFPVVSLDPRAANAATSAATQPPMDGFWAETSFRGAFSATHNWADGWGAADAYGFFPGNQRADEPQATLAVQTTTVSFQSVNGQEYLVECSSDGRSWSPVKTIMGDGNLKTIANEIAVDSSKFYRVMPQ